MSGIVGVWYRDGQPLAAERIPQMLSPLAHRGPDGTDLWCRNEIGLGSLQLRTTPESLHETLPLVQGDLVLTADARIDNRADLLRLLDFGGRPPAEISDSEIILSAYQKWGKDYPRYLIGDYAFVIWDQGTRQMFLARDSEGVRPFYYTLTDHLFAFASEIKGLLALPEIPKTLNKTKIAAYLTDQFWSSAHATTTFYEGILRLPPAHWMSISAQGVNLQRYWTPQDAPDVRLGSDTEYAEAYREKFEEAVRCRLRSLHPIGSTLSGGLDSSAVVCMARRVMPPNQPLHTYYALSELPERDERGYVEAVLTRYPEGLLHHDLPDPATFDHFEAILRAYDQPTLGSNPAIFWNLYHTARDQGVQVMLDGEDGDGTVSHGHSYLGELAHQGRWADFVRESRTLAQRRGRPLHQYASGGQAAITDLIKRGRWIKAVQAAQQISAGLERPLWRVLAGSALGFRAYIPRIITRIPRQWRAWHLAQQLLSPSLMPFRPQTSSTPMTPPPRDHRERVGHAALWQKPNRQIILEETAPTAAAWGIEDRHPFMDRRLVEFCVGVPGALKLHDGYGRYLARLGMEGILPPEVQWRGDKTNFSPSMLKGVVVDYGDKIRAAWGDSASRLHEVANTPALQAVFEHLAACAPDWSWGVDKQKQMDKVRHGYILSLWLNQAEGGVFTE